MAARRRRIDVPLVVVSFVIAIGLALIVWGLAVAVTGDDRDPLPDEIEAVSPEPESAQVPQQAGFTVDLAAGYQGVLAIDDTEVPVRSIDDFGAIDVQPGQQVPIPPVAIYTPGTATITFTPSDDAVVSELTPGLHTAAVTYWKVEESRAEAATYRWQFTVV